MQTQGKLKTELHSILLSCIPIFVFQWAAGMYTSERIDAYQAKTGL